jgi:hypothetical protein
MSRRPDAGVSADIPTVRGLPGSGSRLAAYDRELRQLKAQKRETTRVISYRIKFVEVQMSILADEILEAPGAPTGNLFNRGDEAQP